MFYLTLKALHFIFIVTWFAGLFYIVRLFIYDVEARENKSLNHLERNLLVSQFSTMQRRLWYGITWPSCLLAISAGLLLTKFFWPYTQHPWLVVKIVFAIGLILYHLYCGRIYNKLQNNAPTLNSFQLRLFNELATIFLVAMVFLAIFKDLMMAFWGVVGLIVFSILLVAAILIYKKVRTAES